ncbi:TBC1 domain family member 2 [Nematocida sp. AWRm80]|nr:TBC1 domain family member 2 [Nematocida sp. AWRm80]
MREVIDVISLKESAWFGVEENKRSISWLVLLDILGPFVEEHPAEINRRKKTYFSILSHPTTPIHSPILSPTLAVDKTVRQIEKDVKRLETKYKGIDLSPRYNRAMSIFSKKYPVIGYVQGMCEIFKVFLEVHLDNHEIDCAEALAYFCFTKIVCQSLDSFSSGQQGIERSLVEIEDLLEKYSPRTIEHLKRTGVEIKYFGYNWMSTFLFREFNSYKSVLDAHFSLGSSNFMRFNVSFAVSIVIHLHQEILSRAFESILQLLQNISQIDWTEEQLQNTLAIAYIIYSRGELSINSSFKSILEGSSFNRNK